MSTLVNRPVLIGVPSTTTQPSYSGTWHRDDRIGGLGDRPPSDSLSTAPGFTTGC